MNSTLKKLRQSLVPLYGERETEAIIRLIFLYLKGWNLTDMLIHREDELSPFIKKEIDGILIRLLNHEPIQYITGIARFHGMDLKVRPGVLIPRPETDELTDIIIKENDTREDLAILDIGTGSGCIAIALARNLKFPHITAIDVSREALYVAEENAASLKVKIRFLEADIYKWNPQESFDIIVSNPPYIDPDEAAGMSPNVLMYEPHQALFDKASDPVAIYKRIAAIADSNLSSAGKIYLEINPRHADAIRDLFKNIGMEAEIVRDSFGKERFVICKKGE